MPRAPSAEPKCRVNITMPPELYRRVQELAAREERPFSHQAVRLLEKALGDGGNGGGG